MNEPQASRPPDAPDRGPLDAPDRGPLDAAANPDPSATLMSRLVYGLSLPERTVRSVSVLAGGLVHETASRLIPLAFRSSRSYRLFVQQALDMMVHDIGGVARGPVDSSAGSEAAGEEAVLARKAVGGLLDLAGAATLHLSPMTVLAVFSDLAYGSGHYLGKLSDELKREGIIHPDSSIDHVADLVDALRAASERATTAVDTPPVSLSGITETIRSLSEEISKVDPTKLIPQAELERVWQEMEDTASRADVGLWDVSTTMTMYALNRVNLTSRGALSSIRVAGSLLDEHLFDHYRGALREIETKGFYVTLSEASGPYLEAVWLNFDGARETWTEELLSGRLIERAWGGLRGWWTPVAPPAADPSAAPATADPSTAPAPKRSTKTPSSDFHG